MNKENVGWKQFFKELPSELGKVVLIFFAFLVVIVLFSAFGSGYFLSTWDTGNACENLSFDNTRNFTLNITGDTGITPTNFTLSLTRYIATQYLNYSKNFGYKYNSSGSFVSYADEAYADDDDLTTRAIATGGAGLFGFDLYVNYTYNTSYQNITNITFSTRMQRFGVVNQVSVKVLCLNQTNNARINLFDLPETTSIYYTNHTINIDCIPKNPNKNLTMIINLYQTSGAYGNGIFLYELNETHNVTIIPENLSIYMNTTELILNQNMTVLNSSVSLNTSYLHTYFHQNSTLGIDFNTSTRDIGLLACIDTFEYTAIKNITFLTENDHELFKGNMTLDHFSDDHPFDKTYTVTGFVDIEVSDGDDILTLEYYDNLSEQPHRFYYVNENETLNLSLFVVNSTNVTTILFTLYDEIGNVLPGYYVALQKKWDFDGEYYTVEMHKTDFNGQTLLYGSLYTDQYKFLIYDPNLEVVYSSTETELKSTSITLTLNIEEDLWYSLDNAYDVDVSAIVFNNDTQQFSVSYNDPNNVLNYTIFKTTLRTAFGDTTICENVSTASTATLYCTIPASNASGYYLSSLIGETNSNNSIVNLAYGSYQRTTTSQKMGKAGIFMAMLVFIVLVAFGLYNPAVAILLSLLSLIVVVAMQLVFISIANIVIIVILGGILLFKMRT